uniref:Uncharacterized protein n=1 Tax=uncultured prokaryote TaxID=198431 RepID=A0A0H5PY75_9ZZZZ|nr:hypothetical protein [uncultured prokaryote]
MRYQAELTMVEILDTTTVSVNLQERHTEEGEQYINRQVLVFTCEDADPANPRKWLRDVLMAVVEGL